MLRREKSLVTKPGGVARKEHLLCMTVVCMTGSDLYGVHMGRLDPN